ncbi:EF hand protein (macronuclear) [Tetrahymena thermophila SB210]|uniref:EF hand protein n=1 Tax=Tetrahymena thermophila (strain SB210) TaxID=312017 RepID=Q22Y73_TETTS|nr:EF hand protein [Tetrahymena thermophila SB210]EAR90151.2 EF hand protein [Tetrahymena thermophila SB210]|eukprot:XP_001010396.2 EF hand protein [Tetrahymena thermophila SB210]
MYKRETRNRLCELLILLGQEEKYLEDYRQVLCQEQDFEPFSAFKRIDRKRQGFILASDIQDFLSSNGAFYELRDCQTYIYQYDIDLDNKLSYMEFLKSLLPFDNPELRQEVTQRPSYEIEPDDLLPYDVENALLKFIEKDIYINKKIENHKILLHKCSGFSAKDAFSRIDRSNEGDINFTNLSEYMTDCGCDLENQEDLIINILRRLDRDDDGRLNLAEFILGIQPLQINLERLNRRTNDQSILEKQLNQSTASALNRSIINKSILNKSTNIQQASINAINNSQFYAGKDASQLDLTYSRTINNLMNSHTLNKNLILEKLQNKHNQTNTSFRNFIQENKKVDFNVRKNRSFSNIDKEELTTPTLVLKQDKFFQKKGITKYMNSEIFKQLKELILIFREIINFEKEIELCKQNLALCPDFNLQDAYRVFDSQNKGLVTQSEFQETLSSLNIFYNIEDIFLFYRKFDKDHDGRLRFSDFIDAFLPKQKEYAKMINCRQPINKQNLLEYHKVFQKETRLNFEKLLDTHLQYGFTVERMLQNLHGAYENFELLRLFELIDSDDDGYILFNDLRKSIELQGFSVSEKELGYLSDRFCNLQEGRIPFQVFIQELTPQLQF